MSELTVLVIKRKRQLLPGPRRTQEARRGLTNDNESVSRLETWSEKACSARSQPCVHDHFGFHSLQITIDRSKCRVYGKRRIGDNVKQCTVFIFEMMKDAGYLF